MSNADANANADADTDADAGVTAIALPVLSYRRAKNAKNDRKYKLKFIVVAGHELRPILGSLSSQKMKLITLNKHNILCVENIDITEKYKDIFIGEGKLGGKLHLEVDKTVTPVKLPVRKVPIAVKEKLKNELERLQNLGVIQRVTYPTEWISSMVVVNKANNKIRLCIDPKPLNKALQRNNYPTPTIDDLLPNLSKARIFSVADTKNGFWHIQLDDASSDLTTFGTPWGRYRWLRLPFGISPSSEEFQRRLEEALEGLNGVKPIHDDILIYGCGDSDEEAMADHDKNLEAFFQRCREKNIRLNKDKLRLRQKEVSYMGHTISSNGLKADKNKIDAIVNMPYPTDKHGVQRYLGMVNYLQKFAPHLSDLTLPLRDLLKQDSEFVWEQAVHGECIRQINEVLTTTPVLRYFDPELQTVLQCDSSDTGLGACLMQMGQPVAYASRSLTDTERNYAQCEKELLSIVFGMEKFETYVYGRRVLVESDHKPLEIICRKSLVSAPKRLQRMLLQLQKFDYHIVFKPGSQMYIADTLSRAYLPGHNQQAELKDQVLHIAYRSKTECDLEVLNVHDYILISENTAKLIKDTGEYDNEYQQLKFLIMKGWPETREKLSEPMSTYFTFRDELSIHDGIILKGDRVVIPPGARDDIVRKAHASHIGIQGCIRRAREYVYWPHMARDIEQFISKCDTCNAFGCDQQKETLISHDIPSRPWQKIGCDLFEYQGKDYLICVDYYSNFFEVDRLYKKTASKVIKTIKGHIARHGLVDELVSDNGPPFNSRDFSDFARSYEFKHTTSSPGYPQSNGKAENSVKTVKRLIKKALHAGSDPYLALLDWRNTPTEGVGSSPAQRLFGRRTKTLMPATKVLLHPHSK